MRGSKVRLAASIVAVALLALLFAYCTGQQGRNDVRHVGSPSTSAPHHPR